MRQASLTFPPNAIEATLHGIALPTGGQQVDELGLDVHLTRPPPPGALPVERARAWRDAGGRAVLSRLLLRWGPLDATGQGTLTLDERLQPRADATLIASGVAPALDALARNGTIPAGGATAAKAIIAILAAPAPGAPVRLPVQLADGVLTVAASPCCVSRRSSGTSSA